MSVDTSEIDRLHAVVREHKRQEREHRRAAQAAAQQRDALIAFCKANNIPYLYETAQPQEAQPNDHEWRSATRHP